MADREKTRAILILADMIEGEVNRMCVTHEIGELIVMSAHAEDNIKKLYSTRLAELQTEKQNLRNAKQ